ncbi:helix-turn-helix domain-containing protein [Streptomyces candidus]|uniref:Transcriptional regulator with XRE-family HTH domain n=1 Tax=Streptomyces candidus TaxID=67283 RepID=A0A7X0LR22_9ACTN|nr:helix-turn-helix transcriptional regulator [Streptomyces candidus]MBB6437039.1 transcriptional regulator with XRE-family HTH domain [Streptomyces candidus]GHH32731.1 transcriptional regulator [Streptomyces candidus]
MSNIYGDWLKEQREAAGLTQQQLADLAVMTRSHISHIEAGRRIPSKEDARRLDKALGTGNVLTSFLPQDDAAVADYFEAARQLEQQATAIREFGLSLVPGILQTERYMRAVLNTAYPPRSEAECDRLVVTRLERANILTDSVSPVVWALLDQAVLARPAGGPAVMAEQLMHIVHLAEIRRVRVHILPCGLGAHPLQHSMLSLMWFEDQPPVAYSEALGTGKLHDAPAVVEWLQGAYDLALGDALPLQESLALMRATAKDYGHP